MGWVLVSLIVIATLYLLFKGVTYMEEDDVPPWRKFKITCPVCQKIIECWKYYADQRIDRGFGVHNMDAGVCKRCNADLAEPYMRHPYVAQLVAEAKRAEGFKTMAAEYNAAIKATRKDFRS